MRMLNMNNEQMIKHEKLLCNCNTNIPKPANSAIIVYYKCNSDFTSTYFIANFIQAQQTLHCKGSRTVHQKNSVIIITKLRTQCHSSLFGQNNIKACLINGSRNHNFTNMHFHIFRHIYGQKRFQKLQSIPMRYVPKNYQNSWAAFRTLVPSALSG